MPRVTDTRWQHPWLRILFGAPVAHEDHARRAALAALGLQRTLAAYRETLQRTRSIDFRVRIGLNTPVTPNCSKGPRGGDVYRSHAVRSRSS